MTGIETSVSAVVVYADRARITRTGKVDLEKGDHRLQFSELPTLLDADSVRAAARGTAKARLLGVDVKREFYVETPAERVRDLLKQVESLQDEMAVADSRVQLLTEERESVRGLLISTDVYARGLAYGKTKAADQIALMDGLRQRADDLERELQELRVGRRDQERQLQKLHRELEQLRSAGKRERYSVFVDLEVEKAGELAVELTYVISGAGWQPLYDLRLHEKGEKPKLEFGYLAQVTQRTGEDWEGVGLTLSTARPALSDTLPELDPWYISPLQARQPRRLRAAAMKMAAPAPVEDSIEVEEQAAGGVAAGAVMEAQVVMAEVESSGAAVTYRVPGKVTIPADGEPHKVAVAEIELEPELDYVTAPKLLEAAFRRAKVANDSPYTILPGTASIFAGEEFVGTTELELTAPNGELELYLGADDRVTVVRELKRREVDKKFVGDRRRLRYGYQIDLKNLLSTEAKITLYDQIPLSRHENIKVKLESIEPKPKEQSELNLLEWEFELGAGEELSVRFDFTVEHPRDMSVIGLP